MNKVILMGNLGADPELKVTAGGMAVLKLRLATNKSFKDKSGEKKQLTEWHSVTFFNKQAEGLVKHLTKGQQILVEGELRTSTYEKDGETRYRTEIVGSQLEFVGDKKKSNHVEDHQDLNGGDNDGVENDEIPF